MTADDPWGPDDHLRHAAEILRSVEGDEHGELSHLTQSTLVAVANVHARIAHASVALAMLEPREHPDAEDAPGLAALVRLTEAIEGLADAETRPSSPVTEEQVERHREVLGGRLEGDDGVPLPPEFQPGGDAWLAILRWLESLSARDRVDWPMRATDDLATRLWPTLG